MFFINQIKKFVESRHECKYKYKYSEQYFPYTYVQMHSLSFLSA